MKKQHTFKDHLRSEARKSAAASAFERRYSSEMSDEADAPDAVGYDRTKNTLGDKYKGMGALPTNRAGVKEFPRSSAKGLEAVRNFAAAYLRD